MHKDNRGTFVRCGNFHEQVFRRMISFLYLLCVFMYASYSLLPTMSIGNKYFFEKIIFLFRMALVAHSLQKSPDPGCTENLYIPAGR